MSSENPIIRQLPPKSREVFNAVWDSLAPADQRSLKTLITGFPSDSAMLRVLVKLSADQIKMTFGSKHRVAIVGPANVGKSTLYNLLIQNKHDRAEVSPLPGTTRTNQSADAGLFNVVDTPGADAVGYVGALEQEQALQAAREADFLIIVFDAIQGIKQTELELYQTLLGYGKPYIVVLNKIDLVRKESQRVLQLAAQHLELTPEQVIPVVARTGENLDKVLLSIAATEPGIVAALGAALPQYRWQLAWRSIVSAASIAAAIALIPLPILDFGPLLVTQSMMVLGIARIYNYKITAARARELAVTFGLGFLGRSLFAQLSKLGGLPGWLLAAAIASSTTVVMGYAAAIWFEKGERLSNESLKKLTAALTQSLLSRLKSLGKKNRPDQQTLKQQVEQALEEAAIGKDRSILDQQAQTSASAGADEILLDG